MILSLFCWLEDVTFNLQIKIVDKHLCHSSITDLITKNRINVMTVDFAANKIMTALVNFSKETELHLVFVSVVFMKYCFLVMKQ